MPNQNYPSRSEIQKTLRKLNRSKEAYSYVLPPNASVIERTKYDICRRILKFKQEKSLNQRQLAEKMDIPETRVSEILHYKIWKFSLDTLLEYYQRIHPKMALRVA